MNDVLKWLELHWAEMLAYLGIGGASGYAGKKMTDKQQDQKIKEIQEKQNRMEEAINNLSQKLETNSVLDDKLRDELKEHRNSLNTRLIGIEKNIQLLIGHLLK